MKKTMTTFVSAAMFLLCGAGTALAQDEEEADPVAIPVEGLTCDYRDGKGRGDLDKVITEWNEWMDDNDEGDYFAAVLAPNYFGEAAFDVAWLGAWRDGDAMGASTDLWINEGGEIGAKFIEVLDCGTHTNFAVLQVKTPPEPSDDSDVTFVLSFSNCSMEEGKTFDEYLTAQDEWNAYADEHGIVGGSWVFFPIFGESDDSYDFKSVDSTPDHTTFGHNWQLYSEGHFRKADELFDDLLDCDSARVYDATVVREMSDEDN